MRRFAPLSGIVFVVLIVVGFGPLANKTPGIKKTPAEIADFYSKHHSREAAAAFVVAFATLFLVLFVASAWSLLRDEGHVWTSMFFGAGILAAAGFLVGACIHYALADGAHHGIDPAAVQALNAIDADDFLAFGIGVAIMMLGAAGALIPRSGALKVLGWLALVIGIVSFTPAGFIGFIAAGLWIIAASIVLFMQAGRSAADVAPAAA
jgi:hypothetical protein